MTYSKVVTGVFKLTSPTFSSTDDIILFVEASIKYMKIIKECFNLLCVRSIQKVDLAKSYIFSQNVDKKLAFDLNENSMILFITDLVCYLGVFSIHLRFTISIYKGL